MKRARFPIASVPAAAWLKALVVGALCVLTLVSLSGREAGAQTVEPWEVGKVELSGNGHCGQLGVPTAAQSGVKAIAAGGHHDLALKEDGTVVAWGGSVCAEDNYGQSNVPAGLSGVKAIAAGAFHSMALKQDGTVVAWGRNNYGQSNVPAGLSGVKAIAAGTDHSLALKQDGTVVAWGDNSNTLQVPAGLSGVKAIAAGGDNSTYNIAVNIGGHSLALKENGTVVAWGSNSNAQTTVPTNLSGVKAIAAGGFHNLALKEDGTVVAWGKDFHGQTNVPAGLSGVKAIAAGMQHSLALKEDGTVVIWGKYDNREAFLPPGLGHVQAIAANGDHSLLLKDTTVPAAVGSFAADAGDGQVSLSWDNPSTPDFKAVRILRSTTGVATSPEPNAEQTQVYEGTAESFTDTGLTNATRYYTIYARDIAGNYSLRTVATAKDGTTSPPAVSLFAADAGDGQVSLSWDNPSTPDFKAVRILRSTTGVATSPEPNAEQTQVYEGTAESFTDTGPTDIGLIDGTTYHYTIYTVDDVGNFSPRAVSTATPGPEKAGTVVAWGANSSGQSSVPAGLSGVKAIAAGGQHGLALKKDGTVVAWGYNASGQSNVPAGLGGVKAIAAGFDHSLALKEDGTVVAWGDNFFGQTNVPAGLSGVKAIAAGMQHSLALKEDGTVVAWGDNFFGQSSVPATLSGVKALAGGTDHSLALKEDGTVVAWGRNTIGQSSVPTGLSGVKAIAAGQYRSLALKEDGTVVAWGFTTNVPAGLSGVTAIASGQFHDLALKEDGTIVAWGDNNNVPAGLSGVTAIAAGRYYSLALEANTAPAVVGSFDAEAGDGEVSLSWDNPSTPDFQDVRILRSTSGAATSPEPNADQTQVYEGSDELFTDTGLTNGTTYYYTIYARVDAGNFSPRTVVSNVTPSGAPPTANAQSVEVAEDDKGAQITLSGSGASGSAPLSYKLTSLPTHGTLYKGEGTDEANKISTASAQTPYELGSGVNRLTYVPDADYNGTDSFTYKANDGTNDSNVATVTLTVNPVVSPDQTAPRVSRVEPRENATGMGPGTNVRAFFSEAMMEDSISTNTVKIFKAGEDSARKATVTYDEATNKATLDPSADLRRGQKYRVVVLPGAKDEAGNRLDQDKDPSNGYQRKVWRFTVMN